jgi:tetratricopeptide (TPR) repeat protein
MIFKKSLIPLMISMLALASCSSTSSSVKSGTDPEELEWLSNEDFSPPAQVNYEANRDIYPDNLATEDAVSNETLARVPVPKLDSAEAMEDPLVQAVSRCYAGRFEEGFKALDAIYRRYKGHPGYWNQLGTCYYLQGNQKKALLYYNKARDIDAKYAPAVNNVGVLYQAIGQDQKALAAYKRAAELNTFSMTPIYNMAQIYLRYGFIDQAERYFAALYKKNKDDNDVIAGLAYASLAQGDAAKAVTRYAHLPKEYYERADIGPNVALALKGAGRDDDAKSVVARIKTTGLGELELAYLEQVRTYIGR